MVRSVFEGIEFSHESNLSLLSKEYGWSSRMPQEGTPAYSRLHDTLLRFTNIIESEKLPRVDTSSRFASSGIRSSADTSDILGRGARETQQFQERRRVIHDELCRMILGTSWEDTKPDFRERITDFAFKLRSVERSEDVEHAA